MGALTMMDGLESARAGQVGVMITAMDTTSLPAPLLRSGRVELWLRMRLPDEGAREMILHEKLGTLPHPVCNIDVKLLAETSRGLSGADLKAVVEEGKFLYAYALVNGKSTSLVEKFFLRAIETCLFNRRNHGRPLQKSLGTSAMGCGWNSVGSSNDLPTHVFLPSRK